MPNWCDTDITIECKTELERDVLYNDLRRWMEGGYGLRGIAMAANLGYSDCLVRGTVIDIVKAGDTNIRIAQESAWSPALKIWLRMLNEYVPGAKLYYTAVEIGSDVFLTNEHVGWYWLDSWDQYEYLEHRPYSREEVLKLLEEITGEEVTVKKGKEIFEDLDIPIALHELVYCDPEEVE